MNFLGNTDQERKDFAEQHGITSETAQAIIAESLRQAKALYDQTIKEIQTVIGPHGSLSRVQAGGIRISPAVGMSAFTDGVLKTTIQPDGDLLAGSDIADPTNTTFVVFVNEQTYNNELMGAGDLLIGDNTSGSSNVKYDASEGQLQFRLGTTVNVYMDTDGSLKAGGGAIILNSDGILVSESGSSFSFKDTSLLGYADISYVGGVLALNEFTVSTETNQISNGTFETRDLTSWTKTAHAGGTTSVDALQGYLASYGLYLKQDPALGQGDTLSQNISATTYGCIITFRARRVSGTNAFLRISNGGAIVPSVQPYISSTDWRVYSVMLRGAISTVDFRLTCSTTSEIYVDNIVVRPLNLYAGSILSNVGYISLTGYLFDLVGADANRYLHVVTTGAAKYLQFNADTADIDTVISGDTDTNLIRADASTDRVGIGTATPAVKLDVNGTTQVTSLLWDGWSATTATATSGTLDSPSFEISFNADMTGLIGLGYRIKLTQSTVKYFIVTKVGAFSAGATIITCYGGTDYSLVASGTTAITNVFYSSTKAPFGFPVDPTKWTVQTTNTGNNSQSSPAQNTWYNLGSVSFSVPIGVWRVNYKCLTQSIITSTTINEQVTLSTANNSESDGEFTGQSQLVTGSAVIQALQTLFVQKVLGVTTKTTYYMNARTTVASVTSIAIRGDVLKTIINVECVYL